MRPAPLPAARAVRAGNALPRRPGPAPPAHAADERLRRARGATRVAAAGPPSPTPPPPPRAFGTGVEPVVADDTASPLPSTTTAGAAAVVEGGGRGEWAGPADPPRPPPPPTTPRPPVPSDFSTASPPSSDAWFFSETGLNDWTQALGLRPGDAAVDDLVKDLASSYDPAALAAALAGRGPELAARAAQVTAALAGFGARVAADAVAGELDARAPQRAAELKATLTRLGPSFVKVGQILSTRPDLLPPPYLESLSELQDDIPPFATPLALAVIEEELGVPVGHVFEHISPAPVAAASLGQVYKAVLKSTGEAVAIKVQRPGIAASLAMDMLLLRRFAAALDAGAPALLGAVAPAAVLAQSLVPLVDEFAARLFGEVDYVAEGKASEKFAGLYSDVPRVRVPAVHWAHTTRRVLTLEWIDGVKLTDAAAMAAAGLEVVDFVNIGVACTLRQLLQHGYFHADPHPGNLLATPAGDLVYLDFGMMSSAPPSARTAILVHVAHLVARDYPAMCRDYYALGFVDEAVDTSPIAPALAAFFDDVLDASVDALNFTKIVDGLGGVLFSYPFTAPPYYVLILRSLTVLEGLALQADPSFKLLGAAWPYMARRLLTDPDPQLRAALVDLVVEGGGGGGGGPGPGSSPSAPPPRVKWDRLESLMAAGGADLGSAGLPPDVLAALGAWALGGGDGGGAGARLRTAAAAEAARLLDAAVAATVRSRIAAIAGEAAAARLAPQLPGDEDAVRRAKMLGAALAPHLPPALVAAAGLGGEGDALAAAAQQQPWDVASLASAGRTAAAAAADALRTVAGREAAAALASELASRFAARSIKAALGPLAPAAEPRRVSAFGWERGE